MAVDEAERAGWSRRAFVMAWLGAVTVLGTGAALRWRHFLDELTRAPSAGRGAGPDASSTREATR